MSCPDCFRGGKATGDPQGTTTTLHGVSTYIAGPPDFQPKSASTIIYFTDAFGPTFLNNKLLADAYASGTGLSVLVPDLIPGGAISADALELMDGAGASVSLFDIPGQLWRAWSVARVLSHFAPFLWRAYPSYRTCTQPCVEFARKVRAEMPEGAKLGVAGFCWGGYQALALSAMAAVDGGEDRLVDAEFCAHPSALDCPKDIVDAVVKFKTPVSIAHAREDMALKTQAVEDSEAILRQKVGNGEGEGGYYYQIKIYEGVGHGFAVRAKPGSNVEADAADEAKAQAVEWFKRWL
ncbi:alpha/beta-hydrolase [Corynespora cassiicola Philippines]|uniref:Alpha/beta-hydrolase n=1 Tax=Corynespora cassiicola Philippines TaxID=1448308 RepID=A0A2T2NTY0_CORCC|nr:alpha/beta-hydrolase [Corynespora cassiicola Philippines]